MVGALSSERVVSVYFDDPKRSLARNGASLRVRRDGGGCFVVAKADEGPSGVRRAEVERAAERPVKFLPLGIAAVDAVIASGAPLRRQARVAYDRLSAIVAWEGGRIEIAADIGEARFGAARRAISEIELELMEGPPEAVFSLARGILSTPGNRLRLRLASKAPHKAKRRIRRGSLDGATAGDVLATHLARAGEALERATAALDRRKPKACRNAARALRRVIDAADFWGADDARMSDLAEEARQYWPDFQRAEQLRRLARESAGVDFGPSLVNARADAQRLMRSTAFELFRLTLLQRAMRAPNAAMEAPARNVAAQKLDQHFDAVAAAASESERRRALAGLASALRAAAKFFPKVQRRAFRRLVRDAHSAYGAADRAREECALAAEAAAGQGAAAARAAGFIAGAAAAEAAAHLAAAPGACDALLSAQRFWREDQQC